MATTINAGRVRFVSRGTYNNSTQYYLFDLVDYNGSSYIAKENTVGNLPTNNQYWQLIAEKGNTGSTGQTGPVGPTGNGISSITKTGTSGLVDTYTITYTNGNTTTFTITNGEDGEVTETELDVLRQKVANQQKVIDQLPQVTGQGTEVTLENTIKAPFTQFDMEGHSEQDGEPTPETPIPVKSCGENVNMFEIDDIDEIQVNGIKWSAKNNIIHAQGTATNISGKRETISFNMTGMIGTYSFSSKEKDYVYCRMEKNGSVTYPASPITLDGTETLVQVYPQILQGLTVDTDISIKIEKGTHATPYSPYGMGCVNEKVENKNLLEFSGNRVLNEDGSLTATTETSPISIEFKQLTSQLKSDTYTFSNISGLKAYVMLSAGDYSHQVAVGGKFTFNYDGTSLLRILYVNQSANTTITYKAQLEKGSTATSYVPHEEQDYSIFVQQPMRSIGDVRDGFAKVNGVWNEKHLPYIASYNGETLPTDVYTEEGGIKYCNSKSMSTTGQFSNGASVQYVDENNWNYLPCTPEQIQQLENLPSTYKDFTIIQSQDETPAYLEVSGIYDLNKIINN